MFIAESRPDEGIQKQYVQDVLVEQKELLVDLVLERDTRLMLCGNGYTMAKDVD